MLATLCFAALIPLTHAALPTGLPPTVRLIGVDEALHLVGENHPDVIAAQHEVHAARAAAQAMRGRLLPRIDVMDTHVWSYAQTRIPSTFYPGLDPARLKGAPQDVTANILAVSAAQPLLGLLHLSTDLRAAHHTHHAQKAQHAAQLAVVRARVRSQIIRLFEARALAQTAVASQQSLEEQVEDARQEVLAGALTQTDVLRMEVAAANAKQQVIAAQADAESLHADLLEMLALGDAPGPIDFIEPSMPQIRPEALAAGATLRTLALTHRPELTAQSSAAEAARLSARARTLALLPEINVQGSYGHIWGEPMHVAQASGGLQVNAFSVMLSAKWGVWEWGASYYAQRQAAHAAHAAAARAESARRVVGSEVASKHALLLASASAIDVACAQVASAEEAFRVMQATRSAGSATTTDLLNAEAARTQARMSLVRARYETLLAHVALKRALGDDL